MPSPDAPDNGDGFDRLGLSDALLKALDDIGYETPSPIQEQCIAHLLDGHDIIGQAQTGTGKTAAFALPLLDRLDLKQNVPQVLVLAPTRELAIQVAEAIQSYAHYLKGFHVLPVYGGQSYELQLKPLRRGVHIVVGTPGRVMDHIKRGTLRLDRLRALVLDEADEMLRMGFIDDVEWVMDRLPEKRQIALFSATMPSAIRKVAERFLKQPKIVRIKTKTTTATTIRQRYWQVSGTHKLDALTRILEAEPFDGMLIFVRTKTATVELADKLSARGFAAGAINGDIPQKNRERIIDQLKKGRIDILVATDVAARGLDVDRISHVINYDIPYDPESYVHRIGRTGRAGRSGEAILFVAPREKRMLRTIEKVTRQPVEPMQLPTASAINAQRIIAFKQRISDALAENDLGIYEQLVNEYANESGAEPMQIAAALARLTQGIEPLLLVEKAPGHTRENSPREQRSRKQKGGTKPTPLKDFPDIEMCRYRVEVGHNHNVKPGNIVGAIANEADLESRYIGSIDIYDDYSTVDLPSGMPKEIFHDLRKARVCGRKLNISELSVGNDKKPPQRGKKKAKSKTAKTTGKRKPSTAKKSHTGGGQKRKQGKRRKRATD